MDKKTYLAKVDRSTQKPKGKHLSRPCQRLWGPIADILDIAGSATLQAVSECPGAARPVFSRVMPLTPKICHKYALKGRDKKKISGIFH